MSSILDDILDNATEWRPRMRPALSFTYKDAEKYQKRIDGITGTSRDKPIVKLAWAPDELRWHPYRMGTPEIGYTLPIFFVRKTPDKKDYIAAPRWVLLQRMEPEQFAGTWEHSRYSVFDNSVWDWRGPCPNERYTELRAHCFHDGICCPCRGEACECGKEYAHCWGRYLDPNENLLQWIGKTAREAAADSDVNPLCDAQVFTSPQAQRDIASKVETFEQQEEVKWKQFDAEFTDYWVKQPTTTIGMGQTQSGLIVPVDCLNSPS